MYINYINQHCAFVLYSDPLSQYQSQNEVTHRDDLDYTHHNYLDMEKVMGEPGVLKVHEWQKRNKNKLELMFKKM